VGASPEQLEREIEETRAELAQTIGQIEERVARLRPKRVLADHKPMLATVAGGIVALMTLLLVRRVRHK
jgi:hypothetical protein